jgi:hypothetical protein
MQQDATRRPDNALGSAVPWALGCMLVFLGAAALSWDQQAGCALICVLVAAGWGMLAVVLFVWADLLSPGDSEAAMSWSELEGARKRFQTAAPSTCIQEGTPTRAGVTPYVGPGLPAKAGEGAHRRTMWSGIGVLLLVILGCGGLFGYKMTHGWTEWKVERLVNAACPPGTSRAAVQSWLRSNPFADRSGEHWGADAPKGCYVREVNLDPRNLSDCLWIVVPKPNVSPIASGEMEVYFYFDKQDRLVLTYVRPWVRSL